MSKQFSTECIFNLFLFVEDGLIREFGVTIHECGGDDASKTRLLRDRVTEDFPSSRRFPVPAMYVFVHPNDSLETGAIRPEIFWELCSKRMHLELFENAFEAMNAPPAPLHCITHIEGGMPRIDVVLPAYTTDSPVA